MLSENTPVEMFMVSSGFPRHMATIRLMHSLRASLRDVAGYMLLLWCAVAEHAPTGDLSGVGDEVIETWAGWSKTKGTFVSALRDAGWLLPDGRFCGWEKHVAPVMRARKRRADYRAKRAADRVRPEDVPGTSPERPEDVPGTSLVRPADAAKQSKAKDDDVLFSREHPGDTPSGVAAPSPRKGRPKKSPKSPPADSHRVLVAFREKHAARFGAPYTMAKADTIRAYEAINGHLADTTADALIALMGPYFDLAASDRFYAGAPLSKFLSAATLATLRAQAHGASDHDPDEADNLLYHRVEAAWRGLVIDGIPWPPQNRDVVMGCGEAVGHLTGQAFKDAAAAWAREEDARQRRSMAAQ